MEFRPFQTMAALGSVVLTFVVLELIRRRKLSEELWIPWLLVAIAPLVAALWIAPWAYVASVLYHDTFWYPFLARRQMAEVLESPWGRMFRDWENLVPDARGYPVLGDAPARIRRAGPRAFWQSFKILLTCLKEAPEFGQRRRMSASSRR